jgi:hypothetical protein
MYVVCYLVFVFQHTYADACSLDVSSTRCGFLSCFCGKQLLNRCIVHLGVNDNGTRGLSYS